MFLSRTIHDRRSTSFPANVNPPTTTGRYCVQQMSLHHKGRVPKYKFTWRLLVYGLCRLVTIYRIPSIRIIATTYNNSIIEVNSLVICINSLVICINSLVICINSLVICINSLVICISSLVICIKSLRKNNSDKCGSI